MNFRPTLDIYRDLLVPLGEKLTADERFSDIKHIVHDFETAEPPLMEMPYLQYDVESPYTDQARGSGSATLQTRYMTARILFTYWLYDPQSKQRLNEGLFKFGGLLLDFLRDWTDLGTGVGVSRDPIVWMVDKANADEGFVGAHSVAVTFDIYSGVGK